jgi:hypothetical protein
MCFDVYIIFYCCLHRVYLGHDVNTLQIANLTLASGCMKTMNIL